MDAQIIDAITKLSSWLRSETFKDAFGSQRIKKSIYYYKHKAICELERDQRLSNVKRIRVTVECRDCWGTGSYMGEYDHCWRCRSKGWLFLDFIEMTLPTGAVWHMPNEKAPHSLYQKPTCILHLVPRQWSIGQSGRNMTVGEIAQALNLIESWAWDGIWPLFYEIKRHFGRNDYDYWYYKIPLGNRPELCEFCGDEIEKGSARYHESNQFFEWSTWMCDSCDAQWRFADGGLGWPPFSKETPWELIESEPIQEWLERRKKWIMPKSKDDGGIPF